MGLSCQAAGRRGIHRLTIFVLCVATGALFKVSESWMVGGGGGVALCVRKVHVELSRTQKCRDSSELCYPDMQDAFLFSPSKVIMHGHACFGTTFVVLLFCVCSHSPGVMPMSHIQQATLFFVMQANQVGMSTRAK